MIAIGLFIEKILHSAIFHLTLWNIFDDKIDFEKIITHTYHFEFQRFIYKIIYKTFSF